MVVRNSKQSRKGSCGSSRCCDINGDAGIPECTAMDPALTAIFVT